MEIPKIPIALMNTQQSGLFAEVVDWRIVGGNAVTVLRKYPWIVSLRHNNKHYCGAMLIHPNWLISAKHCFRMTKKPDIWIGGLNFEQDGDFIKRTAEQIVEHPDLDVALIKLNKPVTERTPIKVNNNPNIAIGTQTDAIGWGRLAEGGSTTNILQEVTLPIVDAQKCVDLYGSAKFNKEKMLCAGIDNGGKDACQGDSGGPLIINWNDQDPATQYLVGITSWGIGCARSGKLGVWINIASILPWVLQFIPDLMAYDAMVFANASRPPNSINNSVTTKVVEKFSLFNTERQLTFFETQLYIYLILILTMLFVIYILKKNKVI